MRKPKMVPGPFQNGVEWMVESMYEVCEAFLGPQIGTHFPLIGALFFYILTINMLGIIPGMKSATSSLDLTLALALITFLYVQFWGSGIWESWAISITWPARRATRSGG